MPTTACIQEELKLQPSRLIKLVEIHIYQKTWKASTAYALGDRMKEGDHTYKCTQAGTSGTSKPTFNTTYGATTNDNTVIWTNDSLFFCDVEDTNITWNSKVYRRNQLSIDTTGEQNIEGSFGSQQLNIANVDREMEKYIRENDVRGNEVIIREVREALLATPADIRKPWRYMISMAAADEEKLQLQIESLYAESREDYPNSEITRNICTWDAYDQDGSDSVAADTCGWFTLKGGLLDTTEYPNAVATICDKGLRTLNGCYAHKNNRARMSPGVPLKPIKELTS